MKTRARAANNKENEKKNFLLFALRSFFRGESGVTELVLASDADGTMDEAIRFAMLPPLQTLE